MYNTLSSLERQPIKEREVKSIQEETNRTVFPNHLLFKLSNILLQVTFSVCIYLESLFEMN